MTWILAALPSAAPLASPALVHGGMNLACLALGALAGLQLATGNVIGAAGAVLSASLAGCF